VAKAAADGDGVKAGGDRLGSGEVAQGVKVGVDPDRLGDPRCELCEHVRPHGLGATGGAAEHECSVGDVEVELFGEGLNREAVTA
jgi:hypothetical protein